MWGSLNTHLLAEALDERRLLIVAATCQAFPAASMAEIESLDEISTDCGMSERLWDVKAWYSPSRLSDSCGCMAEYV